MKSTVITLMTVHEKEVSWTQIYDKTILHTDFSSVELLFILGYLLGRKEKKLNDILNR